MSELDKAINELKINKACVELDLSNDVYRNENDLNFVKAVDTVVSTIEQLREQFKKEYIENQKIMQKGNFMDQERAEVLNLYVKKYQEIIGG